MANGSGHGAKEERSPSNRPARTIIVHRVGGFISRFLAPSNSVKCLAVLDMNIIA